MMVDEQPKWRTGKLCYIEIPAVDVARSAEAETEAEAEAAERAMKGRPA